MNIEEIRKLQQNRIINYEKKSRKKKFFCIVISLFLLMILLIVWGFLSEREVGITTYNIGSDKVNGTLRIALLSDLHNREFGENNNHLIEAISDSEPDVIIMCGDMVMEDDPDIHVILQLCKNLCEIADIYYVLGNHEGVLEYSPDGLQVPLDRYLLEAGVTVCYSGEYPISYAGGEIDCFAVSMQPERYEIDEGIKKEFQEFIEKDTFKLVVSHYPSIIYETFYDENFDLGLAGHFHGGQIIIPGIGGLYHKDTGFFPKYYGGLYQLKLGKLIVTRGLGSSSLIPRINNKPEFVIININGK